MNNVSASKNLEADIRELELLQQRQTEELKREWEQLQESLSPENMIRNTLKNVVESPGIRNNVLATATGIAAGFIGKKILPKRKMGIMGAIGSPVIQLLLTYFVRKKLMKSTNHNGMGM